MSQEKKNIDVLDQDLIAYVHHGDQQVQEVPKTILIWFTLKK